MIECKTHGEEYEKELTKMLKDGGQLFSYWQQDRNAEYLCLYTSKFNTNSIEFKSSIVKIENEFRSLGDVKEVHNRWNKQFLYSGIFEDDISAYGVQLNPLKRKDLKPLREEDGSRIYNQFLEILRHNVVSDKGNAFNKIFNLFLCKILDEDKQDDAILDFQWIEGQDNEEILLGRLNGLYKQGMADYLHKEITDYSVEDIDTNQIDSSVERIIKELRLYKNQEFAFVDVYNKESFLENAQIVIEVIKLLQGWQIRYAQKQQFLGEFFELLLNTGFKQESGQYFTPVPLVRFILGSLPITEIIQKKLNENERDFLPHVIDFACGSGHFLTEMMDVLQGEIEKIDSSNMTPAQNARWKGYKADEFGWAKNFIYGIERDYRLAKTAKLACFLNGDGEAEIIHASGLEPFGNKAYIGILNSNSAKKDNNKFDILVANPPYAVSGFKSTVKEGEKSFDLYKEISDKSKDIEILFIERMKQLVKPSGIVGIILPQSLFGNKEFEESRRIILENFELNAIVLLGGNAFMAASINTAILFLRKRAMPISLNSKEDYNKLCSRDKQVVLVKSGEKNVEKNFLGYEFSNRRGSEGINLKKSTILLDETNLLSSQKINSYILRGMQNEHIHNVDETLRNHVFLRNLSKFFVWDDDNFSNRMVFEKVKLIYDSEENLVSLESVVESIESGKRPTGGVSFISEGAISIGGEHIDEESGEITLEEVKHIPLDFYTGMSSGHIKLGDIVVCKDGATTGKCAYVDEENFSENMAANEHVFVVRSKEEEIEQKYLFYFMFSTFFRKQVENLAYNKKAQPGLNRDHIKRIQVLRLEKKHQQEFVNSVENSEGRGRKNIDREFQNLGLNLEIN